MTNADRLSVSNKHAKLGAIVDHLPLSKAEVDVFRPLDRLSLQRRRVFLLSFESLIADSRGVRPRQVPRDIVGTLQQQNDIFSGGTPEKKTNKIVLLFFLFFFSKNRFSCMMLLCSRQEKTIIVKILNTSYINVQRSILEKGIHYHTLNNKRTNKKQRRNKYTVRT